jgi:hypothetical protein
MKNRIYFIIILFILLFYVDCFSFYHDSAFSDTCSGEIEFEHIDTLKVNPALLYYRIHYVVRQGCYTCDVHIGNHIDTLQYIIKIGLDSPSRNVKNIFVDNNFDGFLDLVIIFNRTSNTKLDGECWLFNQESGRFEFNQKHTDILTGKFLIDADGLNQWNSWQLHFINKPNYGLRCAFDIDWKISGTKFSYGLGIPPLSLSKSESGEEIRIASNYLVIAPGFILNLITHDRVYAMLSAIIIGIPNMHLSYELVKEKVRLTLAQRTDFYIFRKDPKIYSDISVGLLVRISSIAFRPNISFPISRGYYKNSEPYIGIDLFYIN